MDVTCNRCGIVYEFEAALISTTGMTVKCTQCGHLFKVHRPAPQTPLPPAELALEPSRWRVRRVDGSTHTLDSLAELTNLISAGQFSGDDEISRTGQVWKKLGEVAELVSLFERPQRVRRLSEPPPEPQIERKAAIESAKRTTHSERPAAARKRTLTDSRFQGMGAELALDPPELRRPFADDDLHGDAQTTGPHPALAALASGTAIETPPVAPASQPAPALSAPVQAEADADTAGAGHADQALQRRRRNMRRNVIGAVFVSATLIVAGIGAGLFLRARPGTEHIADPAQALVMRGDEALAAHRVERFEQAVSLYTQALPLHPDDAHILSSLSRTYAVWSSWLGWRLRALRTGAPAAPGEAAAIEAELKPLTEQAKRYGERAAQRNPGNEEASVALSDALRLSGNLVAARAELDRARATEGVSSAETLRVAALLAIDEADADVRAGRPLAEQAVAQDPNLLRTRFLLARCLLSDNDPEGAELQLAAVRKIDPEHPLLVELEAAIQRARAHPPSAAHEKPGATASDAGRAATPEATAAQANPAVRVDTAATATSSRSTPAVATDEGTDPLELVRRGEAALERGAVPAAQHAFERALELDPRSARARTGLGYVALEHNQATLAVSYFRPAAHRDNPDALIGLGDAYRKLGRGREALEAYQAYLHHYPNGDRRSIAQHQSELLAEQLGSEP